MARRTDPLARWLQKDVYPHLSHEAVFGGLQGFQRAATSDSHYADCPACGKKGTFYMLAQERAGHCSSCGRTITWFSFLRFRLGAAAAIEEIARLAGVETRPDSAPDSEQGNAW